MPPGTARSFPPAVLCHVYRSTRRADTYVYLRERDAFALLPPALAERLGALEHVMALELTPERRLARGNSRAVLDDLAAHGFHLQLPPVQDALNGSRES